MNFIEYINSWSRAEVLQGKIMISIGLLFLTTFIAISRGEHELLRGTLLPLGLLITILIGYGGYILYSRPAHAKESIALYQTAQVEAIQQERAKHINDNKAGKTLMKFVYPSLILLATLALSFIPAPFYKGMALGFIALFVSTFIIDNGFVTRSDSFISFLDTL